jgi:hypothetical protein
MAEMAGFWNELEELVENFVAEYLGLTHCLFRTQNSLR